MRWWGAESMADYYQRHSTGDNFFTWIKAHAGQGETNLG